MTEASPIVVRSIADEDHDRWSVLFAAYRAFYRLDPDHAVIDRVWGWLRDPDHEVTGLVALREGTIVGFAHVRRFSRPSTGTVGLWLDDLFTDETARGTGAGGTLIGHIRELAEAEGASLVRWITAEGNATARSLYDAVARSTDWVVYDAAP